MTRYIAKRRATIRHDMAGHGMTRYYMKQHAAIRKDVTRYGTIQCKTTHHDTTRHDTTGYDTTRYDATRYDRIWHDTIRRDTIRQDMTRHDTTRHDTTGYDTTRYDATRYDRILHDTARYDRIWHDTIRQDMTRHDTTRHDTTGYYTIRHDMTGYDTTRYDRIWHDMIRRDTIRQDITRYGTIWQDTIRYDAIRHDITRWPHDTIQYDTRKLNTIRPLRWTLHTPWHNQNFGQARMPAKVISTQYSSTNAVVVEITGSAVRGLARGSPHRRPWRLGWATWISRRIWGPESCRTSETQRPQRQWPAKAPHKSLSFSSSSHRRRCDRGSSASWVGLYFWREMVKPKCGALPSRGGGGGGRGTPI